MGSRLCASIVSSAFQQSWLGADIGAGDAHVDSTPRLYPRRIGDKMLIMILTPVHD
jgi:hypothetical protein